MELEESEKERSRIEIGKKFTAMRKKEKGRGKLKEEKKKGKKKRDPTLGPSDSSRKFVLIILLCYFLE